MRRGTLQYRVLALHLAEERCGFDLVRELGAVDGTVTSEGTINPRPKKKRRRGGAASSTWGGEVGNQVSAGLPTPLTPLLGQNS